LSQGDRENHPAGSDNYDWRRSRPDQDKEMATIQSDRTID